MPLSPLRTLSSGRRPRCSHPRAGGSPSASLSFYINHVEFFCRCDPAQVQLLVTQEFQTERQGILVSQIPNWGRGKTAVLGKPANTGRRWTHSPVNQRPLSQLCSEITRGKEAGAGLLASETLVSLTQLYTAGTWPCDWDIG